MQIKTYKDLVLREQIFLHFNSSQFLKCCLEYKLVYLAPHLEGFIISEDYI